ncbi:MAG: hypothetical protein RMJ83_03690 [Armatimonadota bacterium]|nr:hypothetical protein [Armatimonadota bacterium]
MTASEVYARYIRTLPIEERIRLIEQICRDLNAELAQAGAVRARDWRKLAGRLPYPALGEDAQQYISRARREADARREPR